MPALTRISVSSTFRDLKVERNPLNEQDLIIRPRKGVSK